MSLAPRNRFSTAALQSLGRRSGRAIFGDRQGLVVFLGVVCAVGLYWRAGAFITDTETVIRALEAVSSGRLWIEPMSTDPFAAPGAVAADGFVYGRNYGQVVLSLPFLWALEALSAVADLRIALTALWHLALLAFVSQLGQLVDARETVIVGGAVLVGVSFLANLSLATSFLAVSTPLLALQLATIVAAGLVAVFTYRLVARRHGNKLGALVGGAGSLVLPIGFWASLPKRHVLVAAILLGIVYSFARSREAPAQRPVPLLGRVPIHRALCYALVGLLAWIHAAEAIFTLLALVVVDLPTAPSNDRRTVAFLAGTFALSMLPAIATNVLLSGDPLAPPRMLTPVDPTATTAAEGGIARRFSAGDSGDVLLVGPLLRVALVVADQILEGLVATAELDRFVQTWIRSGSNQFLQNGRAEFAGSNLTVLESVPLFGAFAAVTAAVAGLRSDVRSGLARIDPTDALALAISVGFVLLYAKRLPVHVQITVRYLLPTYPLLLYLLIRQPPVRALLTDRRGLVGWTYAGAVLLGTQLLLVYVVVNQLPIAAAVQVHALLGLAIAALLAVSVLAATVDDRAQPVAAATLGLAAAAGTAFLLLSGIAYFSFVGEHVLPVADAISELIGRI